MERVELFVAGGGAAGMAAATAAAAAGASVALADRGNVPGGILLQCLHRGFGKALFGRELTGPEYADYLLRRLRDTGVRVLTGTEVIALRPDRTALLSSRGEVRGLGFRRCILAAGCYERTVGSLPIAGARPAGIFTAGTAQALMNLGGYDIGSRVVILGSGDVGQIMARQLVRSGRQVLCIIEQRDTLGSLARNRRDCVAAYRIPVRLRSTVEEILGTGRVSGVIVRETDTGRREKLECDTLVTAIGLIPDRTLCRTAAADGVLPDWLRPAGNCDFVHDMVDGVVKEAAALGAAAAKGGDGS